MTRILLSFLILVFGIDAQVVSPQFFAMTDGFSSHAITAPYSGLRLWSTHTTWADIESSNGTFSFTTIDGLLTMAQSAGSDVIITLGQTPPWASSNPTDNSCGSGLGRCDPPSDIGSGDNYWKAYVTALVNHSLARKAAGQGYIHAYGIWNEPTQDATHSPNTSWTGTPAQIVTLEVDAAAIIHALDPNALVVSPEPTSESRWGNVPTGWFSLYFAAGGGAAVDVIAVHYYPQVFINGFGFYSAQADPELPISQIGTLKSLMASYGFGSKPLWVTEGNWGNITTLTQAQEAAWMVKDELLLYNAGIARNFWYVWDSNYTDGTCTDAWGKMADSILGVCAAGTAYQWLQGYLVGATTQAPFCARGGDDTWSCLFTSAAGKLGQFVWNINRTGTQIVSLDSRFNTCLNVDGSSCVITGHTATVTSSPILLLMN